MRAAVVTSPNVTSFLDGCKRLLLSHRGQHPIHRPRPRSRIGHVEGPPEIDHEAEGAEREERSTRRGDPRRARADAWLRHESGNHRAEANVREPPVRNRELPAP